MLTPNIPVVNLGNLYLSGMNLSYTSTTTLTVAAGQARNSTDTNDIVLNADVVLNVRLNGENGIDTGTLAPNRLYAVYAIGDSKKYNDTASLISLSTTQPLLPVGYDMFRRIGTIRTNATAAPNTLIIDFTQRGHGLDREMWYGDPIATPITAGSATAFTIVNCTTAFLVPTTAGDAIFLGSLTADAGGARTAALRATNSSSTVGQVIMSSPASSQTFEALKCPVSVAANVVSVDYFVSSGAAVFGLSVHGYVDQL